MDTEAAWLSLRTINNILIYRGYAKLELPEKEDFVSFFTGGRKAKEKGKGRKGDVKEPPFTSLRPRTDLRAPYYEISTFDAVQDRRIVVSFIRSGTAKVKTQAKTAANMMEYYTHPVDRTLGDADPSEPGKAHRILLVSPKPFNPKTVESSRNTSFEFFSYADLQTNILEHVYNPKLFIVRGIAAKMMMDAYKATPESLPVYLETDPAMISLGGREGDLVVIFRYEPVATGAVATNGYLRYVRPE